MSLAIYTRNYYFKLIYTFTIAPDEPWKFKFKLILIQTLISQKEVELGQKLLSNTYGKSYNIGISTS